MALKRLISVGTVAILAALISWWAIEIYLTADRAADQSAQLALMTEAATLLDAYHSKHGEYPKSIDEFTFTFPDGGDESILATLRYTSDGATFSITAKGISTGDDLTTDSTLDGAVVYR
jgi:hypothetical protein